MGVVRLPELHTLSNHKAGGIQIIYLSFQLSELKIHSKIKKIMNLKNLILNYIRNFQAFQRTCSHVPSLNDLLLSVLQYSFASIDPPTNISIMSSTPPFHGEGQIQIHPRDLHT